ncbi:MAG: Ribose ABC transport system, permease protein RbsC, partial [uncultured Rubrobacteraceae bacterium]
DRPADRFGAGAGARSPARAPARQPLVRAHRRHPRLSRCRVHDNQRHRVPELRQLREHSRGRFRVAAARGGDDVRDHHGGYRPFRRLGARALRGGGRAGDGGALGNFGAGAELPVPEPGGGHTGRDRGRYADGPRVRSLQRAAHNEAQDAAVHSHARDARHRAGSGADTDRGHQRALRADGHAVPDRDQGALRLPAGPGRDLARGRLDSGRRAGEVRLRALHVRHRLQRRGRAQGRDRRGPPPAEGLRPERAARGARGAARPLPVQHDLDRGAHGRQPGLHLGRGYRGDEPFRGDRDHGGVGGRDLYPGRLEERVHHPGGPGVLAGGGRWCGPDPGGVYRPAAQERRGTDV